MQSVGRSEGPTGRTSFSDRSDDSGAFWSGYVARFWRDLSDFWWIPRIRFTQILGLFSTIDVRIDGGD